MQEGWPIPVRVAAGAIGSALAWHGTSRKSMPGIPITLIGCALLGRALTGADSLPSVQGSAVKRTITIDAPIDQVFHFWAHYDETFPHCLTRVKQITAIGQARARWVLDSPGTADILWNTVVTRCDPNRELAWETERGSATQHAGRITFIDSGQETTTIHLQITYNALAEALVRGMASSRGIDTKTLLSEDLDRIKTAIETGVISYGSSHRPAKTTEPAT